MTPEHEKDIAESIVRHLGKSPEVPADVATRLRFAREQAIRKYQAQHAPPAMGPHVLVLRSRWRRWVGAGVLLLLVLSWYAYQEAQDFLDDEYGAYSEEGAEVPDSAGESPKEITVPGIRQSETP